MGDNKPSRNPGWRPEIPLYTKLKRLLADAMLDNVALKIAMRLQVALRGIEEGDGRLRLDKLQVHQLVASSMKTRSVQRSARSSNQK